MSVASSSLSSSVSQQRPRHLSASARRTRLRTPSGASEGDFSEVESRLTCLTANLREQEALISRIDFQKRRAQKVRLARLEKTLAHHREVQRFSQLLAAQSLSMAHLPRRFCLH